MTDSETKFPRTGASIVVLRGEKVLLIKRGNDPYRNHWALPGGRQEMGEPFEQTARRELVEETGLVAEEMRFLRIVDRMAHDNHQKLTDHFVLAVYLAGEISGIAIAGDDAVDIGWFSIEEMQALKTTPDTPELLTGILALEITKS